MKALALFFFGCTSVFAAGSHEGDPAADMATRPVFEDSANQNTATDPLLWMADFNDQLEAMAGLGLFPPSGHDVGESFASAQDVFGFENRL